MGIRKWVPYLIVALIIAGATVLIVSSLLQTFANTGLEKQTDLNLSLQSSREYVEILSAFGNEFLSSRDPDQESDAYRKIVYDATSDSYALDARVADVPVSFGSLSGIGPIPSDEPGKAELHLVLSYSTFFQSYYDRRQDLGWVYYTSERDFIYMYPSVGDSFAYTRDLKQVPFFSDAAPKSNPEREAVWTPLYIDEAGKGLMVTLSSPVYRDDTFLGVVSLDLTTRQIQSMLDTPYNGFLADANGDILAAGRDLDLTGGILNLSDVLPLRADQISSVTGAASGTNRHIGTQICYIYHFEAAPWTLVLTQSVFRIGGQAFLLLIPIIAICVLWLFTRRESENRKRAEAQMRLIAWTDELTGLKNRYYLDSVIEHDLSRADRYHHPLSIIMFDLDRFKVVNDTWGHDIGDQVLRGTADVVKEHIRTADTLTRIGGEEFLIMLPDTNQAGAIETAEKIRKVLEKNVHPVAGVCTASFGVAERSSGETYSSLYRRADEALYRAKEEGRNRVVAFESLWKALKITWDSTWECGEPVIDEQHRNLVRISADILSAASTHTQTELLDVYLDELIAHAIRHFKYEEQVMKAIGYPELERHTDIHDELIREATRSRERHRSRQLKTTALFSFIFNKLIIQHLLEEDTRFFPYLAAADAVPDGDGRDGPS